MDRIYRIRIGVVIFLLVMLCSAYTIRLFTLQLAEDDETTYDSSGTTTYSLTVSAARGEILDRHGTVLVSNRATYGVVINSWTVFNASDPNGLLLTLAQTCIKNGIEYTDTLPLSSTYPYTYDEDKVNYTFKRFLLGRDWDADMTAENLAKKLKSAYNISDEYTDEEARLIMGLRYELDLPIYAYTDTYTLSSDITADQLAIIKELSIPGLDVTTSTVREYNTSFAAQLLGHIGSITSSQTEYYAALGYASDATVGQDGMEAAFEEYLHGTDGVKVVTMASDGTVVDEYWEVEPVSGSNVITTIDIGLQEVAEKALASRIQEVATTKTESGSDGYDANAGAVVVMDVNTGEVLAAANYPTYDPSDYYTMYDEYVSMETSPLQNRALQFAYPPGSTFKMITAVAAMRAGVDPSYTVYGSGYYEFSDGTTLRCWIINQGRSHGTLDMQGALAQSCNIYFYTVGQMTGISLIDEVATSFGIGQDSGSEIYSNSGTLASPTLKAETYTTELESGWYDADTATAAIGQSLTTVTPLQLCRYIAAVANGGTLYNATFFIRAVSKDFQTLVSANSFSAVATDLLSAYEAKTLYEGMRLCVTDGTGSGLKNYTVEVCAKTGTASHGTGGSDNGAFVCYAPADDPEIAIAIYVEHGASGSNFYQVAEEIMDYYFNSQYPSQEINLEDQMTED